MKKPKSSLKQGENRYGYLFVLPFVLGFVFLYSDVLVSSVTYSFSKLIFEGKSMSNQFVGLDNFKNVLTVNAEYLPALTQSLSDMFTMLPVILIFSLFLATLLNRELPGRAFFRSVFFLPVILATGVVAKVESNAVVQSITAANDLSEMSANASGLGLSDIQNTLQSLSISTGAIEYIVKFIDNIYSVVNCSGVQIILMLASLQSISPSVYEAASIEGASAWESFWKITIPMVAPVIFVCALYTVIDQLSRSTNGIMVLIEKTTQNTGYGIASAMAWIYFGIIVVIVGLAALICRKGVIK